LKHKIRVGNKVIIGSGASVIDDIADEDIVAGVPAKSIKHKVNSEQLFLMAGHTSRPKIPISDKRQQLHY
jgi:UDP-3-O-[3-hydroxymyristoyl] glucosamine N-acyltransferase